MIAQGRDEHQQAAQLVVRAELRPALQAVDHIGVFAARIDQGPQLALAVLEHPLLVRRQRLAQIIGQRLGEARVGVEAEQQHRLPLQAVAASNLADEAR